MNKNMKENSQYENITLNNNNIYYVHKQHKFIISLKNIQELLKQGHSITQKIEFIRYSKVLDLLHNENPNKIKEAYNLEQILTGDKFNIVYLSPKEELSLLEEELDVLREANHYYNSLNLQQMNLLDRMAKQLTLKIINCKEFIEELKNGGDKYD